MAQRHRNLPLIYMTQVVEDFRNMFYECSGLFKVPAYDLSSNTNTLSGMFDYCPMLQSAPITGAADNISFAYCLLGRDAIVEIFNGLAAASAAIDVSNNYGAADLTSEDIAIAEDKGWTVSY